MIQNLLNKLFKPSESSVHVIQYPNEYIIETFNSSNTGTWVRSSFVSVIPLDIKIDEFERLINLHLDLSKKVNYKKYDIKSVNESYKKITIRNSIKKQMENAILVSIYRKNNLIEITPNINGGTSGDNKGFRAIRDKMIILDKNLDKNKITKNVIKLFSECK